MEVFLRRDKFSGHARRSCRQCYSPRAHALQLLLHHDIYIQKETEEVSVHTETL